MSSALSYYSDECSIFVEDIDICLESLTPEFIPEDTNNTAQSISEDKSTVYGTFKQIADYMREDYWTGTGRKWRRWPLNNTGGQITVNIEGATNWNFTGVSDANGITNSRKPVYREAFKIFEELLNIDFVETTSRWADILFTDNEPDAFSDYVRTVGNTIKRTRVNVHPTWHNSSTEIAGDYLLQTIIHEIGHAMGLGHPGPYNGEGMTFTANAAYANDCWDTSIMSYWDQQENPNTTATKSFIPTLMTTDLIALDDLYKEWGYGISNSFTGNTTYGFNTNISASVSEAWRNMTDYLDTSSYTITDGSGTDTIDLSGFSTSQQLDLSAPTSASRALKPSTVGDGAQTQNLFIAPGTVIENGTGGSGNDLITGNNSANYIKGNAGNDTLKGGSGGSYPSVQRDTFEGGAGNDRIEAGLRGTDVAVFSGNLIDYSFSYSGRTTYNMSPIYEVVDLRRGSPDGTDTLVDIERVRFANRELSIIDATYTTIESQGNRELLKDSAGKIWAKNGNTRSDITSGGQRVGINSYRGWTPVAAENLGRGSFGGTYGQNKVIWTHSSGTMAVWELDANWRHTNTISHAAGSAGFLGVETDFQMDFNNDGVIG